MTALTARGVLMCAAGGASSTVVGARATTTHLEKHCLGRVPCAQGCVCEVQVVGHFRAHTLQHHARRAHRRHRLHAMAVADGGVEGRVGT